MSGTHIFANVTPQCLSVGRLVRRRRSVIIFQEDRKLHFHSPIEAIVKVFSRKMYIIFQRITLRQEWEGREASL